MLPTLAVWKTARFHPGSENSVVSIHAAIHARLIEAEGSLLKGHNNAVHMSQQVSKLCCIVAYF